MLTGCRILTWMSSLQCSEVSLTPESVFDCLNNAQIYLIIGLMVMETKTSSWETHPHSKSFANPHPMEHLLISCLLYSTTSTSWHSEASLTPIPTCNCLHDELSFTSSLHWRSWSRTWMTEGPHTNLSQHHAFATNADNFFRLDTITHSP